MESKGLEAGDKVDSVDEVSSTVDTVLVEYSGNLPISTGVNSAETANADRLKTNKLIRYLFPLGLLVLLSAFQGLNQFSRGQM